MRAAVFLLLITAPLSAAEVDLALTLPRTQYTLLDPIEFALAYSGGDAKTLPLEVRHADGSTLRLTVPLEATDKPQTQLVSINGLVLKTGRYTAVCRAGREPSVAFSVHQPFHPNPYFTAQWVHHGEAKGTTLAKGGWMYFNSDLATLHPKKPAIDALPEWYVAARMQPFARMILGGGHQLDLDLENDWGDPWVQRTIVWRMQLAALSNRIYPIAGLHCYDEPGLTWWPIKDANGKTLELHPFVIPHQLDEFERKTGKKMPVGRFSETAPQYAGRMDDWLDFMDLRMKYLEQAWNATVWGTESVNPGLPTINQVSSSYAPGATTDGVDSRQNRPYKIVSGHGGYSDLPFGTMQPVRSAEAFRGFSWDRPHYFLPMWYTHTWATMRNAVWMAWTTKLDGMMYTPEQDFGLTGNHNGYHGAHTVFEVAEINRKLARVGAVLEHLPKTPAPIAVIHSHTQFAHDIATFNSPKLHTIGSPQYVSPHRDAVDQCFFRVMEQGITPNWIDEVEAAEKGVDFLKQWKALMCPRLAFARPAFRKALEDFIAGGGKLIQFKGDKLILKGSIVADHDFGDPSRYYEEKVKYTGNVVSAAYRDLAWRKWTGDLAPTFARDLQAWIGSQSFECSNKEILLGVYHSTPVQGEQASYLLFANNAQSRDNPRGLKHELVAAETKVKVPKGIVYDLFHGGEVPVRDGEATLRLAAGDGACWLHLPRPVTLENEFAGTGGDLDVGNWMVAEYTWRSPTSLPVRIRIFDPLGRVEYEHYRGTHKIADAVGMTKAGAGQGITRNDLAGKWTVEVTELWSGKTHRREITVNPFREHPKAASLLASRAAVHHGDVHRIVRLLAGEAEEPPYELLNWDSKRVFGLDPKKFAVFGPDAAAKKLADALKAKGKKVEVNPNYEIKPFVRELGRGGAGITHGGGSNLENIHAHTIVLSGHPLLTASANRGHIHREVTPIYPGLGRAHIQWGIGCYQPGWNNVFVLGDLDAGVAWLLDVLRGGVPLNSHVKSTVLSATATVPEVKVEKLPLSFEVVSEQRLYDTPVGVGSRPDGSVTYVALHDGSVTAFDANGKTLWETKALLEGCALAVSPKGDRVAVAGYPGLLILDAVNGKVLGGFRADPVAQGGVLIGNRMTCVAWNAAGTFAAGGWLNPDPKTPLDPVIVDASGKVTSRPSGIVGGVMGAAFAPGGDVVLLGADQLTAVNAVNGEVLWRNPVKGAQAFTFTRDGKTAAAGGWGKSVAVFDPKTGTASRTNTFDAIVGGVTFLPDGALAVAVWGGTRPLMISRGDGKKPDVLFESEFGFQNVRWSESHKALIAAEQGGRVWLLDQTGKPRALLSDDSGTTVYRLEPIGEQWLAARMNRVVQRLRIDDK